MNKRDIYTKIIVGAMIKKGHMDLRSMHKNAVDARKKNEALLFEILKRNKDTEYGRLHGFSEIKTLDDFQKKVPVTNYHDYEDH